MTKLVVKSRRVLRFNELTSLLVGKHIQFFNHHSDESYWSKIGVCTNITMSSHPEYNHIHVRLQFIDERQQTQYDSEDFYSSNYTTTPRLSRDGWAVYLVELEEVSIDTPNTGRTTCWNCGCATEKRRDFSDMSIREFCPRCRI